MDRQPQLRLSLHTQTHTRYLTLVHFRILRYSTPEYFPIPLQSSYPFCDRIIFVTDIRTGRFPTVSVFIKIVRKLWLLPSPDRTVEL